MKILIVEDDVNSRIYLERALLSQGYAVESAVNGVMALEKTSQSRPDLIISDIMMPEMDGFELCRRVKTDEVLRSIPIVFYTATYIEAKDEKLAMTLGASRFLIKPMELDDLFDIVKSVIDDYQENSLDVPLQPLSPMKEIDRMQLEVLAGKLDKKVRQLEKEREVSRKRENKYRKLLESMMDGFVYVDMDGLIRESNDTFKKMLGYTDAELKCLRHADITPEKWHAIEKKIIQEQVLDRGFSDIYEKAYRRKDGSIFPAELHTFLIKCEQGENEGMWAIVRDIAQRKQSEVKLEKAAEEWQTTFNSTSDQFMVINKDYLITNANLAVSRFLNLPMEEIIGHHCYEVMHGAGCPLQECPLTRLLESMRHEEAEYNLVPQGVRVQETVDPVIDGGGKLQGIVHIVRDVTESKKLEAQLHQAQKMELIGRLAGGVAHDYNNMLSVIIGYVELALEKAGPDSALHEDLQEILSAAKRTTSITRQLLTFARKQTIMPQVLDLNDTISGMTKMLQRLIGEDKNLAWLPGPDLWPVKIDPSQIDQLLANLCVNARDAIAGVGNVYIETGTASIDSKYSISQAKVISGDYVLLVVSDNGCGIEREVLDNIFEPFFTTKEPGKGTGLGLSTVYGIVQQHNGFINVYSEPGQGTTFRIYLPRYIGEVADLEYGRREDLRPGHGETVLVTEDDATILKMIGKILENLGYTVITANSPADAVRIARERSESIDLLLSDIIMPGMNGRDLAERIHAIHPKIKCLFMSGYAASIIEAQGGLQAGIRLIQKPFSIKRLAAEVRSTLGEERDAVC
jgi:two-component system cell cycle sensor histidine kinase/response regulator CckA